MICYFGGKFNMAKWLNENKPSSFSTYVEPFGGAFWNYLKNDFNAQKVVYNDMNKNMVNLFYCLSTKLKETREYALSLPYQNKELFEQFKSELLSDYEWDIGNVEKAVKYVYCHTQIYSGVGLHRTSHYIHLNGAKGKYHAFQNKFSDPKLMDRVKGITNIHNDSYERMFELYDSKDTFFYIDPPYYGREKIYKFHDFDENEHIKLIDMLKGIEGKFMLSYYDFPLLERFSNDKYNRIYKEFNRFSGSRKGKKTGTTKEVLITNYKNNTLF